MCTNQNIPRLPRVTGAASALPETSRISSVQEVAEQGLTRSRGCEVWMDTIRRKKACERVRSILAVMRHLLTGKLQKSIMCNRAGAGTELGSREFPFRDESHTCATMIHAGIALARRRGRFILSLNSLTFSSVPQRLHQCRTTIQSG